MSGRPRAVFNLRRPEGPGPSGPLGWALRTLASGPPTGDTRAMRIVSAAEAVAGIRDGDQVYLHCAAATPSALLDALVARAPELHDVGMIHLHTEGPGPHLAPEMAEHF